MIQADASESLPTHVPRGPVALVYSPYAGSAHGAHPQALLEDAGITVGLTLPVAALDGAEAQGPRWREAGCVAVVAAGGDGTVGAVASHAAEVDLPLGILPLGTANDIARTLGIPMTPADAAQIIAQGALRRMDAGQAIPAQTAPHASSADPVAARGAYFLHALSLGLNVEFARRATAVAQRRLWGKLTYVVSAIESLEHLRPTEVTLRFTGAPGGASFETRCETTFLMAINLPVFGGRLELRMPAIRTDDRMLDVIVIETPEPHGAHAAFEAALEGLVGAARLFGVGAGTATTTDTEPLPWAPEGVALPGGRWFRAQSVEIVTERPVELTLDGELRGQTPAVACVAPHAVWIIAPEGGAEA